MKATITIVLTAFLVLLRAYVAASSDISTRNLYQQIKRNGLCNESLRTIMFPNTSNGGI